MRALHIVSINLQKRLGENTRSTRQQDVAVNLMRLGPLRMRVGQHMTHERGLGGAVQNTFIHLVAGAVRGTMAHKHDIGDLLAAVRKIKPVVPHTCMRSGQVDADGVMHQPAIEDICVGVYS